MYAFYCILHAVSPFCHYISHHAWNYIWKMRKSWVFHMHLLEKRSSFQSSQKIDLFAISLSLIFRFVEMIDFLAKVYSMVYYIILIDSIEILFQRNYNKLFVRIDWKCIKRNQIFRWKLFYPTNTHYLFRSPTVDIPRPHSGAR